MNFIQACIRYPLTVGVAVIFVFLFGLIGLYQLPNQLIPNIDQLRVTIETVWPGASPYEIEREIIDKQEEQLRSIEGLTRIESNSSNSRGQIDIWFRVGTSKDGALLRVANRLQQVDSVPAGAEKPVITGNLNIDEATAYFQIVFAEGVDHEGRDISTYFDFVKDTVKTEFERVPGVESVSIFGGRKREMQVEFDLTQLALRQITLTQLASAIEAENRNFSGGSYSEGKRRYSVRTVGEYQSPEDLENIIIATRNGVPVYLRDVASVALGHEKSEFALYGLGQKILVMPVTKSKEANALDMIEAIHKVTDELNNGVLKEQGLYVYKSWTQKRYIEGAIRLVTNSLFIGALLSIVILFLFLRNYTSTIVIVTAIPISAIATFIVMDFLGRSINIISLAGIAFAIGMVVDNSIVVLENIYRHRQMGKNNFEAAYDGTREVWGAVLASTLTTVAVFVPVAFMQEEVGQLFADISIALCSAVLFSLIVSMSVIPSMAARVISDEGDLSDSDRLKPLWRFADRVGLFKTWIIDRVAWLNRSAKRQWTFVTTSMVGALLASFLLLPEAEYLPVGNTDYMEGFVLLPPGYNLEETLSLHRRFSERLTPLAQPEGALVGNSALPGGGVQEFFFGAFGGNLSLGVSSADPTRAGELIPVFQEITSTIPGAIGFFSQWNLFSVVEAGERNIDLEIKGPDLDRLIAMGQELFPKIFEVMPEAQAFPIPALDNGNPELQIVLDRDRAASVGLSNQDLGFSVRALIDGAKVSDYIYEGREIDLKIIAKNDDQMLANNLDQLPIAAPNGQLISLGSVATTDRVKGAAQIAHRERRRTITLRISPPADLPLEAAIALLEDDILTPYRESGKVGLPYQVSLSGSASKLVEAGQALQFNLLLAIAITYLLLCVLFQSFYYPMVILISVPFAAFGGVIGLSLVRLVSPGQGLDVLTMLGFVILVGTVVNNAILIVHRTLQGTREHDKTPNASVLDAIGTRIRPIFMSVGTSSLAMLPLVLFPGAGSELYRGLGGVVVGGMLISTLFTLFLVPTVLSLLLEGKTRIEAMSQASA